MLDMGIPVVGKNADAEPSLLRLESSTLLCGSANQSSSYEIYLSPTAVVRIKS